MKETLPVNREILIWARTSIGLTVDEVAVKMDKDIIVINEWEAGVSAPTYSQLEKLAYSIYKRPVAIFFFPDIPSEATPKVEFRTLPDTIIDNLPPEIIRQYRKAKVYQLNLNELYNSEKPVRNSILNNFKLTGSEDIAKVASEVRAFLGVTLDDQYKFGSVDIAFKAWRNAFENNGIFVFKDAFHNDDYSGFCIYDDKYPVILINNSMPHSRQIFTLFHELAHLLLQSGGIDFRRINMTASFKGIYHNYESLCNRFAGEFLVPSKAFRENIMDVSEKNIKHLADRFSVSREVILRYYLNLKLIDEQYYHDMADKWIDEANKMKEESEGGHYYYTQKAYLGDKYINIAFSKYYQKQISAEHLSEYLNIKVSKISTFEHYALG